jgi:DNA-binding transcriptional regulator YiaG
MTDEKRASMFRAARLREQLGLSQPAFAQRSTIAHRAGLVWPSDIARLFD